MIRRAILLGLLWSVLLAGCHAQTTALAADGHVGKDLPIPCSSAAEATSEHGTQWTSGTQRSSGRDNQKTQPAKGTCRKTVLFAAGKGGYHTYRIPSIIVTTRGTVLAFCEGRKESSRDLGNIDMLVRRSLDGGRTFGPMRVIWNDGPNTCGNPCPVIDRTTGAVWLLMTHNLEKDGEKAITNRKAAGTRTVWIAHSTDDGQTWSRPIEITNDAKRPDWTWYATGPGAGI
ncbi:MAG: exo-alpha-sialidase, partial [Pirellulales bacterium]|nr:exo-alpha-sialidase [Pirellulales bacterium]